jgi:hypothetical protein
MTDRWELPVDSREGIAALMDAAATAGLVLNEWHVDIARKYGVPIPEALMVAGQIDIERDFDEASKR